MMKKIGFMTVMIGCVILLGCKEEVKSEEWYNQHPDETYNVYSKCLKDGESSQNCENARRAKNNFVNLGTEEQKTRFSELNIK
ncbi:EexN family lipoprotein [Arsenophonus sp.]|uniref:EexN family lipoprotein n=1 Tax=Arsenophonus sp. TaxID=1872640 RepID=UPI00285FF566|nr:EexN family lipoprotein [Arsenophonus sp.]MDR5617852.1 EexN family lipoprotein [Arsenophonus sp.]